MDELELLRQKALSLINDPEQNPDTMMRGSELLKRVEEIESSRLSTSKLQKDLSQGRIVEIIQLLAPYATVLILAATLVFQFWQQHQAAKERSTDREEALWADALRSVSDHHPLQAIIDLKYFENSKDHKDDAAQLVLTLFRGSKSVKDFKELFQNQFPLVKAENLDGVLEVDRVLHTQWLDLTGLQAVDPNNRKENEDAKLQVVLELSYICTKIAPVLKNRPDKGFDLTFVALFDCNLSYADLRDARLDGFVTARVNMSKAKLCGTHIDNGYWKDTMWWQADSISPDSLKYLMEAAPLALPADHYRPYPGPGNWAPPTQSQYDAALQGLSTQPGNCQ